MMRLRWLALGMLGVCGLAWGRQTTVNAGQQVVLQGLRSSQGYGSFQAAAFGADGSLYLLLDESDGVRVLHADANGTQLLGQALMGAAGDVGVAMSVDSAGNVYVAGTTTSGMMVGTAGVAYASVADSATNSFVAKYDATLNPVFVTFLGAGRTAATSVFATADSVFVTGVTFDTAFPVTSGGVLQTAASGSTENGFIERFSSGGVLQYATYLTGFGGDTMPAGIVADSADNAYVTGATTASGFPTVKALQPRILLANGVTSSGFVTKLNAAGSAIVFSTFVAGGGTTGMALDGASSSLLLSGSVSLGQFPVATVAMPLTSAQYQTMVRLSLDGQSLLGSVLLTGGMQSFITAGPHGDAWVSGAVGTPLFPGLTQPDYSGGDSFLLHVTATNVIDQTLRFGGTAKDHAGLASMSSVVGAPAVAGTNVVVPGSVAVSMSAALLGTERFDLPLVGVPTSVLPSAVRDLVPSPAMCGTSSVCSGWGGFLAMVQTGVTSGGISLSVDDAPNVVLRNAGAVALTGVVVSAAGYSQSTDCGNVLDISAQCTVALAGTGSGAVTVSASGANATTNVAAATGTADALALGTNEVDFGIVSAADGVASRTITLTNMSGTDQTFSSAKDGGASATTYTLEEQTSDCASGGAAGVHLVAAGASCHVVLALAASSVSSHDGPVQAAWKIGPRDVMVSGFTQATGLNVSAAEFDFGLQITGGVALPRYLYLSNDTGSAIAHAAIVLPTTSAFAVTDNCPTMMPAHSVCQMAIKYQPSSVPSSDSLRLELDDGLSVLLTGESLPQTSVSGAIANPSLVVSASSLSFATTVPVTELSSEVQTLTLTNSGVTAIPIVLSVTGDFGVTNGCPAALAGGARCEVEVTFAPSQPGVRDGLLSVTTGSGFSPTYIALSGVASELLPTNNGVLSIGETLSGVPVVAWFNVQQNLSALSITSSSGDFRVALVEDNGTGHGTLPANHFQQSVSGVCQGCWLGIQFLSLTTGSEAAQISLTTVNGGNPYRLTVTGISLTAAGLLVTPVTTDFGVVSVGSSSGVVTIALTNLLNPTSATSVQGVSMTGDFAIAANTSGGDVCNGTLDATASCYVQIIFTPTATGVRSGMLTVVTTSGTVTSSLTGYGEMYGLATLGLRVSTNTLTFAEVPGQAATMQSVQLTNAGTGVLILGGASSSDPSFAVSRTCTLLAPGSTCNIGVTFAPQAAMVSGLLSIPVSATVNGQQVSSAYSVELNGNYTTADMGLQIVSDEVDYGANTAGALGGTRTYTLNNLSGKDLSVSLQLPRQFPLAEAAPCQTLAAGASCNFAVSFAPMTGGPATGTVFAQGVSADGLTHAQTLAYMLGYGNGAGALSIQGNVIPNAPLNFGLVTSGQSTQQVLTLMNTGSGSLTIRRVSSEPPFLATTSCGAVLGPTESCSVTLNYAPVNELVIGSSTRNDVGTLTIESDAVTSPDFVSLGGGVQSVSSSSPASSAVLSSYEVSQSALTFANTQVGNQSSTQIVTLTNTGTATIHVLGLLAAADFAVISSCGALLPGASCDSSVSFTPGTTSASALRLGALEIQSDATNALEYVSLVGTSSASPLTLSASMLSFGTVNVGVTASQTITVTNSSGAAVTWLGLSVMGSYSVAQGSCPGVGGLLAAGSSCMLTVTFAPKVSGSQSGTLHVSTDATTLPLSVTLSGTATAPQLQVNSLSLSFGSVNVGGVGQMTFTLTNVGTATLTGIAESLSGTNAGDFLVAVPCGVTSLAPGQGCAETVTFAPLAAGSRAAELTVFSSDPNGAESVSLSGIGVAVPAPGFVLAVNGTNSATVSVVSGAPASYPLTLTPVDGFTGGVALTCAAVVAAPHASCSLLQPLLTVTSGPQSTTATISTLSSALVRSIVGLAWLMLCPLLFLRRTGRLRRAMLLMSLAIALCAGIVACGGGGGPIAPVIVSTPAGTYQYQVTASSTSGIPVSSTVTLNLIVQ